MNFIREKYGKFLYKLGRALDLSLDFIIGIIDRVLVVLKGIRQILITIFLGMLMLTFFFFIGGILSILLFPIIINLAIIFILVPFLLELISKGLKILRYGLSEYLYDKSNSILDGKDRKFTSLGAYIKEYLRLEEERRYREEEARRKAYEEQQRRAREEFEEFFRKSAGFGGGSFNSGHGNGGYGSFSGVTDLGFKEKYEAACKLLGVSYGASKEDVRKAFRTKAKEYHPDLNKDEGATEMFQKINDANEFLTDHNIERYKNLG